MIQIGPTYTQATFSSRTTGPTISPPHTYPEDSISRHPQALDEPQSYVDVTYRGARYFFGVLGEGVRLVCMGIEQVIGPILKGLGHTLSLVYYVPCELTPPLWRGFNLVLAGAFQLSRAIWNGFVIVLTAPYQLIRSLI